MSENITLNDQERAALEALWRAGGEMALGDMPRDLRSAFVELDVKGATLMVRQRKGDIIVGFTAEGRALAVGLFAPPLVMPASEEAVRVWLEARGLWAEGDEVQVEADQISVCTEGEFFSVRWDNLECQYRLDVERTRILGRNFDTFRAEFDRASAIARALNANSERSERDGY